MVLSLLISEIPALAFALCLIDSIVEISSLVRLRFAYWKYEVSSTLLTVAYLAAVRAALKF